MSCTVKVVSKTNHKKLKGFSNARISDDTSLRLIEVHEMRRRDLRHDISLDRTIF